MEGSPNGMALVLKTSGRNPLQVRILYPPPSLRRSSTERRREKRRSVSKTAPVD